MKKLIKDNKVLILGLIIGIIVSCTTVYAATTYYDASSIGHTPTSGMNASNVQSALDELYSDYQNYNTLYNKVGTAALTTTSQNLSGAINEINANIWKGIYDFPNNTSTNITLPSTGTYLIATGHNSTPTVNTLWIIRTGGNRAFCISTNCTSTVTFTVSGTTLTGLSTGGYMNAVIVKMP